MGEEILSPELNELYNERMLQAQKIAIDALPDLARLCKRLLKSRKEDGRTTEAQVRAGEKLLQFLPGFNRNIGREEVSSISIEDCQREIDAIIASAPEAGRLQKLPKAGRPRKKKVEKDE